MAQFDLALPKFSEGDLDDAKQRRKIMNYLYKLDEQLRFVLNNLDAENFTETFQQVFVGGGITADGGSVRKLEDELAKLSTKIQQTASQIELKADAEELNELGDAVSQVESDLKVIAGKIESTVTRTEFDELGNKVSENTSLIEQTAAAIRSEVSDAESDLRSEISQTAADIRSEVENTESELRSEISQTAGSIRSEVSSSVSGLQSQINQTDGKIELAVGNVQVGGTNLAAFSKLSFFNAAGTLTGELAEHGEGRPHYCRSGKVVVLSPFSGNYDGASFLNISLAAGKRYTVSFWASCNVDNTLLYVNIFNSGRGVDMNLGDAAQTGPNGGYYVRTFECPVTDTYELRFICFNGHAGTVHIMDVKLEEGTKATGWSPAPEDPVSSLQAGTSVLITEDQFKVTTPEFSVNITTPDGSENMLNIDEKGIHAQSIDCPNVTPRYDGPGTLYVDSAATSAQIAARTHFRSLADAISALNHRWAGKYILINIAAGHEEIGTIEMRGIHCGNMIDILGADAGHALIRGRLNIHCCAAPVRVRNVDVISEYIGMQVAGRMTHATIGSCVISGPGTSTVDSYGVASIDGAEVKAYDLEIYDFWRSLIGIEGGVVSATNCKGNCNVSTIRSNVYASGYMPCSAAAWTYNKYAGEVYTADVSVNQGSKPSTPVVTTTTVSYAMANADNYVKSGWTNYSDDDIRQGYTNLGEHRGCFWFDNAAIRSALNGKAIKQVTLSLYQMSGYGRNQPVQVNLEGITMEYSGRSGTPWGTQEYGVIGTTAGVNQTTTFTIPTKVVTDLVSGTINGLMLRTGETSVMSGQDNSYHFARFAGGTTTAYRPVLTVTYQS